MRHFLEALECRTVPATFYVDEVNNDPALDDPIANLNDPKPGTLRYAMNRANETPNEGGSPDKIIITKMGSMDMSATLEASEAVDIDPFGASDLTIDFSQMVIPGPGFFVCKGLTTDTGAVIFNGIRITGAKSGPAVLGVDRDVIIRNSEISGNTISGSGAGVYFSSSSVHTLIIENSTIAENSAGGSGGGVFVKGSGNANELVIIHNSTISTNTANGHGGGVAFGGLVGIAVMRFSTVAANKANGTTSKGGGLFIGDNGMTIVSSIVSGNTNVGAVASPDIYSAGGVDRLFTAVGSPSGFTTGTNTGNLAFGLSLLLGPLPGQSTGTVNGGETRTHALLPGSPAIDAGINQFPAIFINDQRGAGFARVFDFPGVMNASGSDGSDIGAYESSDIPFAHSKRMDVTTAGSSSFSVVVTYTDDVAINVSSIDVNDLQVKGPNGFMTSTALNVNVSPGGNGTPRVATYTYAAPGGNFDQSDNGTYTTTLLANQVFDTDAVAHAVPSVILGDFYVKVPVPIVVNELGDAVIANGKTSIREAIALANTANTVNATTITFDPTVFTGPTTIQILAANGGELAITAPVTINGPAVQLTLSGVNNNRIFNVNVPGVVGSVVFKSLGMSAGKAAAGNGGAVLDQDDSVTFIDCFVSNSNAANNGGGIATGKGGSVTLIRTTVSGNTTNTGGGGGVYMYGSGTLDVSSSTISGNFSPFGDGGGIQVLLSNASNSSITNSTISGNGGRRGGGIFLSAFLGKFAIYNSTITNNTATGNPDGGGILVSGVGGNVGTLTLNSTILAGNFGANGPDLEFLAPLAIQKVGGDNNLVGVANVGNFTLTGTGNLTGTQATPLNPNLGPLANNGGPTQTHAPLPGSVAINAGSNVLCLNYDQRGFLLDQNKQLSIGSFGNNIANPAKVSKVAINSTLSGVEATQRSRVIDVAITFDSPVSFVGSAAAAFTLNKVGGGSVTLAATVSGGGTVVTLAFTGGNVDANSLADGRYALHALASQFAGAGLDGNGNGIAQGSPTDDFIFDEAAAPAALDLAKIFRIFGDNSGDGAVATNDFIQFRLAFGGSGAAGSGNFGFDINNDGSVAANDFIAFRLRFGGSI